MKIEDNMNVSNGSSKKNENDFENCLDSLRVNEDVPIEIKAEVPSGSAIRLK